jgi:large subunit ribosomal protein L22
MVAKVIRSAMANAQQEGSVNVDNLLVAEAYCDEGPTLKRWRPRAMGRVYPVMKRTSHISVVLRESQEKA